MEYLLIFLVCAAFGFLGATEYRLRKKKRAETRGTYRLEQARELYFEDLPYRTVLPAQPYRGASRDRSLPGKARIRARREAS